MMQSFLDIRTIYALNILTKMILGILMCYYVLNQKTYPGFRLLIIATFLNIGGQILLLQSGLLPVFVSVILSNFIVAYSMLLVKTGIRRFYLHKNGTPVKLRIFSSDFGLFLIYAVLLISFTYVLPDISARITIQSFYFSLVMFSTVYLSYRGSKVLFGTSYNLVTVVLVFYGLFLFLHGCLSIVTRFKLIDYFSRDLSAVISLSVVFSSMVGLLISFIILNNFRVSCDLKRAQKKVRRQYDEIIRANSNLTGALSEIKTLRGILPICSYCKKIRNDDGYWDQLEKYLSEHTDALLSNDLCPDCLIKYPELGNEERTDKIENNK